MDGEVYEIRQMMPVHMAGKVSHGKRKTLYKWLSRLVTGLGLVAIGLLAIPAGILFLLISGAWSVTDRVAAHLEQKGDA